MSLQDALDRIQRTPGFYVKQNWEALELVTAGCYEQGNSYEIYNIPDKEFRGKGMEGDVKILHAQEKTGLCSRCCCGENRGFDFRFETTQSKETLVKISRSWRCCGWAVIPCCAHVVDVHSAVQRNPENKMETVGNPDDLTLAAQVAVPAFHGGCLLPTYYLYNEKKAKVGSISGTSCWILPCFVCDFCGADFTIYQHGVTVGEIKKKGVGSCRDCLMELSTDADKYTVEFDEKKMADGDLDVNFKLAVLAAVIQIDFNYFEDKRGLRQCRCCDIACCGYALPCMPLFCLALCCCKTDDKKDKHDHSDHDKGAASRRIHDI